MNSMASVAVSDAEVAGVSAISAFTALFKSVFARLFKLAFIGSFKGKVSGILGLLHIWSSVRLSTVVDELLMAADELLMAADELLMAADELLMAADELLMAANGLLMAAD